MAEQPDGLEESFEGHLQLAVMLAGRAGQAAGQVIAHRARVAEAAQEAERRRLTDRLDAERAAARSSVVGVEGERWWDRATPEKIAQVWQTAQTWRDLDPDLARVGDEIVEQVQARYGIDVRDAGPDADMLRQALAEQSADQERAASQRRAAGREDAEVVVLMAEAGAAEREGDPDSAVAAEQEGEAVYDSVERREALAARLEGGLEPDAAQARVLADTAQAKPPSAALEAVAGSLKKAPGRASRARGVEQMQSL